MKFSTFAEPLSTVFTFESTPEPYLVPSLHKFRRNSHRRVPKRSRPTADVDLLVSGSKKKRRLRLLLITSRLSRPFSTPATHIVDRGGSKIAIWAKSRLVAPQVLRKAAIMNRVRRTTLERKDGVSGDVRDVREGVRDALKGEMEVTRVEDVAALGLGPNAVKYMEEEVYSVPPSPLGLSNYDALDDEDDWYASYDDEDDDGYSAGTHMPKEEMELHREDKSYYSDFNFLESRASSTHEDADDDDPFHLSVMTGGTYQEKRPLSPPDDKLIELRKEEQREKEITSRFLQFA